MKLFNWNVYRLGNPQTLRVFQRLVTVEDPKVIFLMETKLLLKQLEWIRIKLKMEGVFEVDLVGLDGGLTLFWKEGNMISVLSYSVGHIDANITFSNGKEIRLTGFYGNLETTLRSFSWELLRRLNFGTEVPWLVCGNFNEIENVDEKVGRMSKK